MSFADKPKLFFDLEGTIIDTDLSHPDSAKGRETYEFIGRFTDKFKAPTNFTPFYKKFNEQTAGTTVQYASELLFDLLVENGIEISISKEEFVTQRIREKEKTYKERVQFIGDKACELWLKKAAKMAELWLVTHTAPHHIALIDKRLRLSRFFPKNKRVTLTDIPISKKKPDPYSFNLAIERSRAKPNNLGFVGVAFEDSKNGIESATSAGNEEAKLFVVGVASNNTPWELIEAGARKVIPALHVTNLNEVLAEAGYE